MTGMGFYVLQVSNAVAYLSDDPRACINCHVMTPQYITWDHSSHKNVATCNDCHVPHDNVVNKYFFKAKDGLYHASMYTMRAEPQVIKMHEAGQSVVQSNCIRCHESQVADAKMNSWVEKHYESKTGRQCWECHRQTPHGRVKSLAAIGEFIQPLPERQQQKEFVPDWIIKQINHSKTKSD